VIFFHSDSERYTSFDWPPLWYGQSGAMSAMAFIVNPVNPKVGVIFTSPVFSAMNSPFCFHCPLQASVRPAQCQGWE